MGNGVFVIQPSVRKTAEPYHMPAKKTSWKYIKIGLAALLVLGTLLACVAAIYYWDYIEHFRNWGYLSALVFGFIAGSSLPVPLPYLVVTFSLGGLLTSFDPFDQLAEEVYLSFSLPNGSSFVGIKSRLVWSGIEEHKQLAGMEFQHLDPEDRNRLSGFLSEWEKYFESHGEYPQ